MVLSDDGTTAFVSHAVGSTTRLVLRDARCAVLVVPGVETPAAPRDDDRRRRTPGAPSLVTTAPATRRAVHGEPRGGDVPPAATRRPA